MSGTAKVKPPKNNAEWARNTEKRITQTEHPTSARAGDWVISTHPATGDLIASNVNGGSVVLAAKPAPSDNADEISARGEPFIKVERREVQTGTRSVVVPIEWDSIASRTEGWGFVPTGSSITVPEDGVYLCVLHVALSESSGVAGQATFAVDTIVRMEQQLDPSDAWYMAFYLVDFFSLNAGQLVSGGVYLGGSGTYGFGPSGVYDDSVYTSMSLLKVTVG